MKPQNILLLIRQDEQRKRVQDGGMGGKSACGIWFVGNVVGLTAVHLEGSVVN